MFRTPLVMTLLVGCGSDPDSGTWNELKGLPYGTQLWALGFDGESTPVLGVSGGVFRYTDASGWVNIGTYGAGSPITTPTPGPNGSLYFESPGDYLLRVDDGGQLAAVHPLAIKGGESEITADGSVLFNLGGGMISIQHLHDTTATPLVLPPGQNEQLPFVAPDGTYFMWRDDAGLERVDLTVGTEALVADCHTDVLHQCVQTGNVVHIDAAGALYVNVRNDIQAIHEVYKLAPGAATLELLAKLPSEYNYQRGTAFCPDGSFYMGGTIENELYGPVYRYAPGDTAGELAFTAPGDISCAPDGRLYAATSVDQVFRFDH